LTSFLVASTWLVRFWVQVYTSGLDRESRSRRRHEIESDLWEQMSAAVTDRDSPGSTALYILLRMISGLPADVCWRVQAGRASRRLALANGGTLDGWGQRGRSNWIDRHYWVVPLGLLLATIGAMAWASYSSRPSRLSVAIEAPDQLVISPSSWSFEPEYTTHIETYRWAYAQSEFVTIENLSDRERQLRLDGFDGLPEGLPSAILRCALVTRR
jgi:hypothetical protein